MVYLICCCHSILRASRGSIPLFIPTLCISATAYTFLYTFTVPVPAFKYLIDIPYVCEEFGVLNLLQAHSFKNLLFSDFKARLLYLQKLLPVLPAGPGPQA